MDLVHDGASTIAQKDRISKLADDIIHRILSFLDMKYAIQTSALSKRWKFIWTSMPDLNLNFHTFGDMPRFAMFVRHVLSHRDNSTQVSAVKFTFEGTATQFVVSSVIDYAYSHDVKKLTFVWDGRIYGLFPKSVFRSHTLKHLTLKQDEYGCLSFQPKSAWDFPALETLSLTRLLFNQGEYSKDNSLNLFSKCLNLKDLSLHDCYMNGLGIFNVCAPQLLNLTFTGNCYFPKIFNVVAPKLKNFTASVITGSGSLNLSIEGLDFLEKVNLSSSRSIESNKITLPSLLDLFQKLRNAKFLILDEWIIKALSFRMNELCHAPCPFYNLKCLKIDKVTPYKKDYIANFVPRVRQYLLENSPDATFIIDLPQVPPMKVKRPMQTMNSNTMANKMAKLDGPTDKVPSASRPSSSDVSRWDLLVDATTKKMANFEAVEKQPETIPEEKRMLEAKIKMQDEVIANQKAMFEEKLQLQDEIIANQKAKIQMQDEVIAEQKAKVQIQVENIAKQKTILEVKTHMVEAAKSQHGKLMSLIIKSKIAELKVKIESENPDHEVIRSTGIDMKSVMDLIPERLRVKLEARISSMYEGFKSLLLTHIDDNQWKKIESQLEKDYNGFFE